MTEDAVDSVMPSPERVAEQTPGPDIEENDRRDLDDFSDDEIPHAPSTLNERRRAQKARFEGWLISEDAQEALRPKTKKQKLDDAADEELSVQSLMDKQGVKIIKNPRQYQWELFQRAQKENTIAVLDTGSGKTLIAVLLLQWVIDQELEGRARGDAPKISFFLVASVTLVYQQFAVLEKNIDHKIAKVCGADGADNWNKSKWQALFADHKVIVATADVLHQCLAHSYLTIEQINLLVFDEAHHAKKHHAYARIIKDFYLSHPKKSSRPRIFGMTASPIDAKTDVEQAANELETLLDCRIATTTDMSLTDAIKKPIEKVLTYLCLPREGVETPLLRSIKARFGTPVLFERVYEQAVEISRHLGRYCSDLYLINALSERKLKRYEIETERKYYWRTGTAAEPGLPSPLSTPETRTDVTSALAPSVLDRSETSSRPVNGIEQLDQRQAVIKSIVDFAEKEQSKYTAIKGGDLSSKVMELKRFLDFEFETPSSRRCIVFVETRHTARLLTAVMKQIGKTHMRSSFLVGAKGSNVDEDNFTLRTQVVTLAKFRKGEINCLFATSVAEEGLDVPDCNLVIRFDMYRTMIQYVQSRGRARQQNSKFIHMVESGNAIHSETLNQVRYQERVMRTFCQALPEDRRLEGNEERLDEMMAKEKSNRIYVDPDSGAKLTYGNALFYLANFVSAIPTETNETVHPTYIVGNQGQKFIAEVMLPGNAPIKSAIGKICPKKGQAKRSAAFEACLQLRMKKYMNEHLMPVYQKKLPAMRNALLAVNMKKTDQYIMRTKPDVWAEGSGTVPKELYLTIIDFPDGLEHPHQPLAFLTRTAMPRFPTFSVYLNDGRSSRVQSKTFKQPMCIDDDQMHKLSIYTFRIFKDVFSKVYEYQPEQLSYWLAPANACSEDATSFDDSASALTTLDWSLSTRLIVTKNTNVDTWAGGRKSYSKMLHPESKPLDQLPEGTAKAPKPWMTANILEYSNSLFKVARAKREGTWNLEQPVFEAEKILFRRNMLATPDKKDEKELGLRTKVFLCPEPLRISAITPAVATSSFVWPAIIHRLEAHLIAIDACNIVGIDCSPEMALASMTKDCENSGEHENQERVNFQRGMGENYERLEFIGDTFLKTATTISVFTQNPNDKELEFHVKRMLMLCNQNLYNVALDLTLYEYVRSIAFSRRLWYPEGLNLLEGKGVKKQEETSVTKHALGEKTIADVCEALIGAAFLTHNKPDHPWQPEHFHDAVRAVTKLVKSSDHTMTSWYDYTAAYKKPAYQTGEVSASQRDLAGKVEKEHPYHFNYPRLLRSAFIHPSQPLMYERVPNYERLEFLGDALLDMASISYLFYRFPDKDPQWLTEHKIAMVSNKFLGAVSVNIGFHKHLRFSSSIMQHQIGAYVDELLEAKRVAGTARDYWTTVSDPPKCLPDIVESFVGAMFLDSDFNYQVVIDFFERNVKWYFEDMSIYDTFANNHPCTHLHTLMQTTYGCTQYRLMAKEIEYLETSDRKEVVAAVMIHNDIVSHSRGKSGRYARMRAAHRAIEAVDGLAPFEFRGRFGCNCHLDKLQEEEGKAEAVAVDCGV
ncbi:Dicer-like protein 1 [Recurvomyces mirabilis]|uniref:Dicer-like protein 1 n=1 Tax=Recurvomyces mirabilis TaxID=574656 RepID=A0AAE0WUK5_9PEZI|nr:Dicer-like protein 1 [Recurvomyces mirabilis]KAK5160653.1 Dicer-like protein 1 [Recurvomyces mirabilis]